MSRILRRPMFRGGKVDSRGTGITSGLMDGGRVGYNKGDLVTGGSLVKKNAPGLFGFTFNEPFLSLPKPENRIGGIKGFEFLKPENQFPRGYIEELMDIEQGKTKDDLGFSVTPPVRYNPKEEKEIAKSDLEFGEGDLNLTEKDKTELDKFYETLDIKEKVGDYEGGVPDKTTDNNDTTGNNPSNVEISAQDLIRENAELFKELLGEGQEEKIKKARIQDASDYALKFFEGSQKEGATVGSSAANVASFAAGRPSMTDKAKAANEKVDQTGIVLAINDYISGKRSKEDIQKALSIAAATAKMKEGTIGDQILAVAARQTLTGGKIKEILGAAVGDGEAKGIRTIPAGQENNYKPGSEDEGFFIFEEGTKNVFKFEDGVLKNVFRPN